MGPKTTKLLRAVSFRRRISAAGAVFRLTFLILAGAWMLALLVSRLFALIPPRYFDLRSPAGWIPLSAVAFLALVAAAIFARRPTLSDAARLVDQRLRTKDVFVAAARIDDSFGDYKPLVLEAAENAAGNILTRTAAPYLWKKGGGHVAFATLLVALAGLLLPQMDLLGRDAERERLAERRKLLEESRKAAAERIAALKSSAPETERSKEVDRALAELKQTFNQAKPKEVDANFRKLAENQKDLGQMWRQLSERKLKDAMNQNALGQQFGTRSLDKQAEWKQEMSKGDASGMKKEIAELANLARKLSELEKGAERAKLEQEMKQRMANLSEFVERELKSRPAAGALSRAMEQMGMSDAKGLSQEAMQALQESLDLSGMELDKLAQSARDLKGIEDALRALQMAKSLNKMQALDGKDCEGCQNMGDYADLYKKLMAARKGAGDGEGDGQGPDEGEEGGNGGMGNKGRGRGGKAPEDPDAESDFVPEQSRSAMTAGKILMEWKTKGLADAGSSKVEYARQVENLKRGVAEAILHEQIPPGYHEAIQKYFDQQFKEKPDDKGNGGK